MPVRKEELERAMEVIVDAAMEIETQDNLATADPVFMVQEERRIYGESLTDYDGYTWLTIDDDEVLDYDEDTQEFKDAEEYLEYNFDNKENWYKNYYKIIWHNLQPFFTRKAAERYIRENKHRMTSPRIYVESGYRNREWIAIRTMLKGMHGTSGE